MDVEEPITEIIEKFQLNCVDYSFIKNDNTIYVQKLICKQFSSKNALISVNSFEIYILKLIRIYNNLNELKLV